jgi:hypothetical protein
MSAAALTDGHARPAIFDSPPRRGREGTSTSTIGSPARAVLTIISVGQP